MSLVAYLLGSTGGGSIDRSMGTDRWERRRWECRVSQWDWHVPVACASGNGKDGVERSRYPESMGRPMSVDQDWHGDRTDPGLSTGTESSLERDWNGDWKRIRNTGFQHSLLN
jgi:hypothetical protein